ncbi:MAG: DUF378 domain-containing protein [Syntrophaceticus sp.]
MSTLDKTSLVLVIIGAINWLLVGVARFDLVASLFGGSASIISRVIYTIIGLAGLWTITMLIRPGVETR